MSMKSASAAMSRTSSRFRPQDHSGEAARFHRGDRALLGAVFSQHDSKDVCPARQWGSGLDDVLALARQHADVFGARVGQCLGL